MKIPTPSHSISQGEITGVSDNETKNKLKNEIQNEPKTFEENSENPKESNSLKTEIAEKNTQNNVIEPNENKS